MHGIGARERGVADAGVVGGPSQRLRDEIDGLEHVGSPIDAVADLTRPDQAPVCAGSTHEVLATIHGTRALPVDCDGGRPLRAQRAIWSEASRAAPRRPPRRPTRTNTLPPSTCSSSAPRTSAAPRWRRSCCAAISTRPAWRPRCRRPGSTRAPCRPPPTASPPWPTAASTCVTTGAARSTRTCCAAPTS